MKKKIFIAIVTLFASIAGMAAVEPGSTGNLTKTITLNSQYFKVVVGENLKVIFIDDQSLNVRIEGSSEFESALKIEVKDNTLFLRTNYKKRDGIVYVPIRNYTSEILVNNDSKVYSDGFLKCKNLNVIIADGGYAHIKNIGHVAYTGKDNELEFEKYQEIKL